jgi:hypothetical protein
MDIKILLAFACLAARKALLAEGKFSEDHCGGSQARLRTRISRIFPAKSAILQGLLRNSTPVQGKHLELAEKRK